MPRTKVITVGPVSKLSATAFLLFISFSSFTDAFSMGPYLKLPYFLAIVSFTLFWLSLFHPKPLFFWKKWVPEDVLILLGVSIVCFSAVLNFNSRSVYYLSAYVFVFTIAYYYVKLMLLNLISSEKFLSAVAFSVSLVSALVVLDFLAYNVFGFDLQAMIPRSREAVATYNGLRRSYGFTTEPTIMALYFNTIGLLAVWYLFFIRRDLYLGIIVGFVWFFALMSTFSGAGLPLLTLGLLLSGFVFLGEGILKGHIKRRPVRGLLICLVVAAVVILTNGSSLTEFLSGILNKAQLGDNASVRTARWGEEIGLALEAPFLGKGPGFNRAIEDAGSSLSWYIFLAKEAGVFAAVAFFSAWFVVYLKLLGSDLRGKYFLGAGVFAGGLHYFAISSFWHPSFWIFLAFVSVVLSSSAKNRLFDRHV